MNYSNKKYLVTGGAGFIGGHLVEKLLDKGYQVIVIDHLLNEKKQKINSQAKFFKLDINNPKFINLLKKEKPDIIYHLAGPINLRREINDPLFNNALNVFSAFKKMLDYCCSNKVKKFIFVSSGGAVYSEKNSIPFSEKQIPCPTSLYGLANLFLEKLLVKQAENHKLNYLILRFSNVYGPRQWENGVIPSFIIHALKHKSPIINAQGKQTRDFLYINDAVNALVMASETKKVGIFNVGSSQEISLNQLFKMVCQILNIRLAPKYKPRQNPGIQRNILNISKIKKELKWKPAINLEVGLKKTITWFKNKN